jgi:hypothetical protein
MEDPSGILYGETSLWFIWLIWGAIIGVPTVCIVCCCGIHIITSLFFRSCRDATIARLKNFCGMDLPVSEESVYHLDMNTNKRRNRKINAWFTKDDKGNRDCNVFGARIWDVPGIYCCVEDLFCCTCKTLNCSKSNRGGSPIPGIRVYWKSCWSYLLYATNFVVVPAGVVLGGLCLYAYTGGVVYDTFARQMPIWATIAGTLVVLGIMGCCVAHNDESSLFGIFYVYLWIVVGIVILLCLGIFVFLESFFETMARRQWPLIKPYAPDSYQNLTAVDGVARARSQAIDYLPLLIFAFIVAFSIIALNIISAACITMLKVFAKNSLLVLSIVQVFLSILFIALGIILSTGNSNEAEESGSKKATVTVWEILVLTLLPAIITIVLSSVNVLIFFAANTCPWPCMPGGMCWPGAKKRQETRRKKIKRLKGQGKAVPLPCRKHWGPQLAVCVLVVLQMPPEFIAMMYMYISSDSLSKNIDTESAASSFNKINVFSVALGEQEVNQLVEAGIYLLASIALTMLIVHFIQLVGVSHLLVINMKRCLRRCKKDDLSDADTDIISVEVVERKSTVSAPSSRRNHARTTSKFDQVNPHAAKRHPKQQIRAGETVLV